MVFDPFSVIGYVGTTAGLIAFLASTISRLEQFQRDYIDSSKKLRWYSTQTVSAMCKLTSWQRIWSNGYSEQEYLYFWGQEGLMAISEKFELIRIEMEEIELLLYGGSHKGEKFIEAAGMEWKELQDWRIQLSTRNIHKPSVNFINKICFASFRGANLEERTRRLQDKVNDLWDFSKVQFREAQYQTTINLEVDGIELHQLVKRKKWMEVCEAVLTQMYQFSITRGVWSLILSAPDEEGEPCSIDQETGIRVEFDACSESARCSEGDLGIVSCYPFHLEPNIEAITRWYDKRVCHHTPTRVCRSESFSDLFSNNLPNDPDKTRMFAKAAVGLVNWTMLLWNAPWTNGICSCGLRFVTVKLQNDSPGTLATFTSAISCPKSEINHIARKALLMGTSLAEIALKESITRLTRGDKFHPDAIIVFKENVIDPLEKYLKGITKKYLNKY
ncbi:hypothetical protein NHQ30_002943 [Ciborinia camelliae]|nr:hypothetical protein NHQ30_002943 [Ciborinia camelliae]